jgi:hypothetical protein
MKFVKLNSRGVVHIVLPALAVIAAAGIGSYLLMQSHAATLPHLTYNYTTLGKVSGGYASPQIVTDGNQGKVIRLANTGATGIMLSKSAPLVSFITKYAGHTFQLCVIERAYSTGTSAAFLQYQTVSPVPVPGHPTTTTTFPTVLSKITNLSKAYRPYCYSAQFSKSAPKVTSTTNSGIYVTNWGSNVIYVKQVTVTLQS